MIYSGAEMAIHFILQARIATGVCSFTPCRTLLAQVGLLFSYLAAAKPRRLVEGVQVQSWGFLMQLCCTHKSRANWGENNTIFGFSTPIYQQTGLTFKTTKCVSAFDYNGKRRERRKAFGAL